jgi:hypothetical protein
MSILDDLSAGLQGAVDWTFSDCVLSAAEGTRVSNGSGGWTIAPVTHTCRAKLDKKESRDGAGGLVIVTRILILRGSLAGSPAKGNKITGLDQDYILGGVDSDGLGSHWICGVAGG